MDKDMEKLIDFGKFLGVSFEGSEDNFVGLIKNIEARRRAEHASEGDDKKELMKSGGTGSRELKGLVSTINYESGSAKQIGNNRKRALLLCP